MSEPDEPRINYWKAAFWMLAVIFIVYVGAVFLFNTSKMNAANTQSNQSSSSSSSDSSDNASEQQQCIQNAQDLFNAGAGLTAGAAQNLTAQVNACKSEYPIN